MNKRVLSLLQGFGILISNYSLDKLGPLPLLSKIRSAYFQNSFIVYSRDEKLHWGGCGLAAS